MKTIANANLKKLLFTATAALLPLFAMADSEQYVKTEDAELFCRTVGQGDPLVIVHGGPGLSQDYLLPQLKKLAAHHLLIFYDQRGGGRSRGEVNADCIQIDRFASDLDAIRKAFGFERISILGHSFGGFIAMKYAIAYPESVDRLILASSMPPCSEGLFDFLKEWDNRMAPHIKRIKEIEASQAFKEGDPQVIESYFRLMYRSYCFNPDKADELNLKNSTEANVKGFMTSGIIIENVFFTPFDLRPQLQKLPCKTLIIHGESDPIPVSTVKEIHNSIPQSKFALLGECGHFPYVEKPDEFFNTIEAFLLNN